MGPGGQPASSTQLPSFHHPVTVYPNLPLHSLPCAEPAGIAANDSDSDPNSESVGLRRIPGKAGARRKGVWEAESEPTGPGSDSDGRSLVHTAGPGQLQVAGPRHSTGPNVEVRGTQLLEVGHANRRQYFATVRSLSPSFNCVARIESDRERIDFQSML